MSTQHERPVTTLSPGVLAAHVVLGALLWWYVVIPTFAWWARWLWSW